jgi:hypothetical protein
MGDLKKYTEQLAEMVKGLEKIEKKSRNEAANYKATKSELDRLKKTHLREIDALKIELEREKEKNEGLRKKFETERAKNISATDDIDDS